MSVRGGFLPGLGLGAVLAAAAVLLVDPSVSDEGASSGLATWVNLNLGHSSWATHPPKGVWRALLFPDLAPALVRGLPKQPTDYPLATTFEA